MRRENLPGMKIVAAIFLLALTSLSRADPAIDRVSALAGAVCAACHGKNGISISDTIPNLAGQRAAYLENQLRALRDGSRRSGVMNAIASQLSDADLKPLAAYFSTLPASPTEASVRSAPLASLTGSRMVFPADYRERFTHYLTMNFETTRQVRRFYASPTLIENIAAQRAPLEGSTVLVEVYSAKLDPQGKPIVGADGFFEADRLLFFTGMAVGQGWGEAIPAMLRNGDWQYAVFAADRSARQGFSQGECLACHKPLESTHYLFTQKSLAIAKTR